MEFVKGYDLTIQYNSGTTNIVEDILNWKTVSMGSFACLGISK